MIEEAARRKATFDQRDTAPVRLADGQVWHLPKPWLEIRPMFRDGRAATAYPAFTYDDVLDALVEALGDCDDIFEQVSAVASVGAHLLRWHYDLSDDDLDGLLAFRQGDEASLDWMRAIVEVATGRSGPKACGAGGD